MEILFSLLTFPAIFAGVLVMALVASSLGTLSDPPTSLRLLKKALLYGAFLTFLFLSYTFSLGTALATSYLFFVMVFTALFACNSFLFPRLLVRIFGSRIEWLARSMAAFGYAFVLLTFAALLVRGFPLSATIPKPAILAVAFVSLSLFAAPRLIRER